MEKEEVARALNNAHLLMEIVNGDPPEDAESTEAQNFTNFTRFLNAMVELGKKLRGEPSDALFVKGEQGEIEYLGMIPHPDGGVDTGYFNIQATISSTLPGTSGVRKKPPTGRLVSNHIFYSVAKLDARRFRRCKVCDDVFYATRLDAVCCSRQHATQYRTNEFRLRRRENYQYKKVRGAL